MNIEIANRLFEYRKQQGLSQEQLAERIGVSRQAVSKWERAESSPDTDNLIELARLYGVSLDDLLFTDEPTRKDPAEEDRPKEHVSVSLKGIHVIDGADEVHVSWKEGIKVTSHGEVEFDSGAMGTAMTLFYALPVPLLSILYLFIGLYWGQWHPGWVVFLVIPVYYIVLDAIVNHRRKKKKEQE